MKIKLGKAFVIWEEKLLQQFQQTLLQNFVYPLVRGAARILCNHLQKTRNIGQ